MNKIILLIFITIILLGCSGSHRITDDDFSYRLRVTKEAIDTSMELSIISSIYRQFCGEWPISLSQIDTMIVVNNSGQNESSLSERYKSITFSVVNSDSIAISFSSSPFHIDSFSIQEYIGMINIALSDSIYALLTIESLIAVDTTNNKEINISEIFNRINWRFSIEDIIRQIKDENVEIKCKNDSTGS